MADLLKPEALADLWERVEKSRRAFTEKPKDGGDSRSTRIKKDHALYRGRHYDKVLYDGMSPDDGFVHVTVPKIGSNIRILIANLTSQEPQFSIEPKYYLQQDEMGQWQEMPEETRKRLPILHAKRLEEFFASSGAEDALRAMLLDALGGGGVGINYTLWHEGGDDPLAGITQEQYDQTAEMMTMPGVMGKAVEPPATPDETGPVTIRVAPEDFLIDPNATADDYQSAEFMGRKFSVPLADLKRADPKWRKILDGLTGEDYDDLSEDEEADNDADPVERITLFEIYIRKVWLERGYQGGRPGYYPLLLTWAQNRPKEPLRCEVWPYDLRDNRGRRLYPYRLFIPHQTPNELWGQSQAELEEEQNRELNASRTYLATLAKRAANGKGVYVDGAITPEGVEALEEDVPFAFIKMANGMDHTSLRWMETPPLPPEIIEQGIAASRDQDMISGVDEASQGVTSEQGPKTATEAQLEGAKSGARIALLQRLYEKQVTGIAQDQYDLLIQFGLIGDTVSISVPRSAGGTGDEESIQVGQEHLVPAKVSVTSGFTQAQNKQQEIQNLQAYIALTAQLRILATPQNPQGYVNSRDVIERLGVLLGVDKGSASLYDTTEFQQQAMQMQMQQMMMQQQQQAAQQDEQGQQRQHEMALAQTKAGSPPSQGSPPSEPDPEADPQGFYDSLSPEDQDRVHSLVAQGLNGQMPQ